MEEFRKQYPELSKDKTNFELCQFAFSWTDDGIDEITGFNIKNTSTGEVSKFETKPNS